jgi:AMP nucleosidase
MPLELFGEYVLLTNFRAYVSRFSEKFGCPVYGADRPMQAATNADGLTIINFGIGSPNAATVMDLLTAYHPEAVLFLGK